MPGTEKTTTPTGAPANRPGCSFRTQQGASAPQLSRTGSNRSLPSPATPTREAPQAVLGVPAVADPKLASVSASEHPDLTDAGHGLLTRFHG
jgi:hypothetical protein